MVCVCVLEVITQNVLLFPAVARSDDVPVDGGTEVAKPKTAIKCPSVRKVMVVVCVG